MNRNINKNLKGSMGNFYGNQLSQNFKWKKTMVAEMLQKLKFLLYDLYLCYIKLYFDNMFHIYVICFIIYLLYIYMWVGFVA